MNLKNASDFDINVSVALKLGKDFKTHDHCLFVTPSKQNNSNVIPVIGVVDYCNNANDAFEVIEEIFPKLNQIDNQEFETTWEASIIKNQCGILRAAMIVFLEQK